MKKGLFITFEGFEGSGKSTQIKLLAEYLKKCKYEVLILREPGSTKVSECIRNILLDKKNNLLCPRTELLLYIAARAQIVSEKIIPALKSGKIVLCDRFHDATVAYQGYGLGLDRKFISMLGEFATCEVVPDLTILLDIDVKEGLRRIGKNKDRIEKRSLDYHRRVRRGYLEIAKHNPKRVKVVKVKDGIMDTGNKIKYIVGGFLCRLNK